MYKLKYEKRYGSSFRNPWSQEMLLHLGTRSFSGNEQSLWIKSGGNAYCFVNNFDEVEYFLNNSAAVDANDYLETHYDRKENIEEVVKKWTR